MYIVVDLVGVVIARFPDSDAGLLDATRLARQHLADAYEVDYRPRSLRQRLASLVSRRHR